MIKILQQRTDTSFHELIIRTGVLWRLGVWLTVLSILFLIATGVVYGLLANTATLTGILGHPMVILILSQFNLTTENTLATGFSSMLLFITGMTGLVCYWKARSQHKTNRAGTGWLVIGVFFALLSLDEMGSLHENAGIITSLDLLGTSTWESVLLVPLFLVMVFLAILVWKDVGWNTPSFWLLAAGGLMFLSVPLQEYAETLMWKSHDESWKRPVLPGLIEEGTELFATILFFAGMVVFLLRGGSSLHAAKFETAFSGPAVNRTFSIVVISMTVLYGALYFLQSILHSDEGIAVNWFPAALSITVLLVTTTLQSGKKPFVIVYSAFLAGYYASNFYSLIHWEQIRLLSWGIRVLMIGGLIFYIYQLSLPYRDAPRRMAYLGGGILVGAGFIFSDQLITFAGMIGLMLIAGLQIRASLTNRER